MPERILQDFGIDRPVDIDLEAIAWELGARVKYRELQACEARIVGQNDRAIISVDSRSSPRRKRFSIGHELGHWHHHRGRCLTCRTDQIGNARRSETDPERVADNYASDLLLPRYILEPMLHGVRKPTLKAIRSIADAFDVSLTATLIKVVETNFFPILIVCHGLSGRRWFRRSDGVSSRWFPQDELDSESFAFTLLHGSSVEDPIPRLIGADAWFDRAEAARYELQEQSFPLPNSEVCTVLTITDPKMLAD